MKTSPNEGSSAEKWYKYNQPVSAKKVSTGYRAKRQTASKAKVSNPSWKDYGKKQQKAIKRSLDWI